MLKRKFKTLLIIMFIVILALSSFCFADLEEDLVQSEVKENAETLEEPEESIDKLPDYVLNSISNSNNTNNSLISSNPSASNNDSNSVKKGDVYLLGTDVTLDYEVDGNVYILGTNVNISSKILGNLFVCANTINITKTGYISNSFYGVANNINFLGTAYDIYTTSNNFYIEGSTLRDIHSIANNLTLNCEIGRNADVAGENLSFSGKILGDLNYKSKEPIKIPDGVVSGNVRFEELKEFNLKPNYFILAASFVGLILALWLFMKWLAPNFLSKTDIILKDSLLKNLGIGLLSLLAIPGLAITLMITAIAAYAGVLLLVLYILLACISSSIFVIAINNLLAKKFNFDKGYKVFLLLIVTSIIAWALTIMPYVGGVFSTLYALVGFGIVIRNLLKKGEFVEED